VNLWEILFNHFLSFSELSIIIYYIMNWVNLPVFLLNFVDIFVIF
jgi:hypothetical protein